ncbi:MAG: low molecular weight phosphotyrosine protein phosphatase [Chitinophagaceae bacterium]|nr:low molecular weight phosphotyrosine protein phosphatase [Chitinophagaceae bacterium]
MVCLGNICRSPLAEGVLQTLAKKRGLNWEIASAGTAGYHIGEAPHVLSQKVAKVNGIDISEQRCRKFSTHDFVYYDQILVMDQQNLAEVLSLAPNPNAASKVSLLLDTLYPGENREVPDPWYGEEDGYHNVFALITRACEAFLKSQKVGSPKVRTNR